MYPQQKTAVLPLNQGAWNMSNKTIHIGFALNNNYVKYLAATMASILSNLPAERNIFFHIITGDINTENKRRLNTLQSIHPFEIEYIPALTEKARLIPRNHNAHVSAETNFRLEITSLKPELDKILFLDADLIVNTDISVLWDMDITDYCAACVPDAPNYKGYNESFRLQADLKEYYNTGVCLMNLKQCRQNDITRRMEAALRSHADILRYPDQDLLNIGFNDCVLSLPPFWNIQVTAFGDWFYPPEIIQQISENPFIFHYAGPHKPWASPHARYADLFWEYSQKTPFFADVLFENIRPVAPLPIPLFKEYLLFRRTLLQYYTYKVIQKITWGNTSRCYKQKGDKLHEQVRKIRTFLK